MSSKIGVVGFQGDVSEHISVINRISDRRGRVLEPVLVRRPEQLEGVSAIIIPGGESTTIYKLTRKYGLYDRIISMAKGGTPVMGTCAGLILISRNTNDDREEGMNNLDEDKDRKSYGRQIDSFMEEIEINGIGRFPAVFIRAPVISDPGEAMVMARRGDEIVMVRQKNVLGLTFHPELTADTRIHEYFINMVGGEGYTSSGM